MKPPTRMVGKKNTSKTHALLQTRFGTSSDDENMDHMKNARKNTFKVSIYLTLFQQYEL